jgi:trans-2,3-dihydro-3-hydroxyanthranilate isomerase
VSLTFYIVDVFAEERYAGNQLAVIRGGADLSDETLGKIALEMNYSETTFVLSDEESGGYDVRIFTPGAELPFAGHPTLGAAYVIRHEILAQPVDRITLNLKAGRIPVTFGDVLWMRQLPPTFGPTLDPAPTAQALNLEMMALDDRFPVQEVSTGLPAIIVPLENLDTLQRCQVDWERYVELAGPGKNLYVFCPEPHADGPGDLSARMFANDLGVPEDPATGSAAGCLAGYLVEHRYFGTDSIDVRVEQGYEIRRPSLLYLRAEKEGDETIVHVGCKVQMVAKGELNEDPTPDKITAE